MSEAKQGLHAAMARYTSRMGPEAEVHLYNALTAFVTWLIVVGNGSVQFHIVDAHVGNHVDFRWTHRLREKQRLDGVLRTLPDL